MKWTDFYLFISPKLKGNTDTHNLPAKKFRPAISESGSNDDDDDNCLVDGAAGQDSEVSSQESIVASSLSEVESDGFNASSCSSYTSSNQEEANLSLYLGTSISAKNFNAMFLALRQKHNLPSQAVDSILKLIKSCLLTENKCPGSAYQFEKSLHNVGFAFKKYFTCWKCQYTLLDGKC